LATEGDDSSVTAHGWLRTLPHMSIPHPKRRATRAIRGALIACLCGVWGLGSVGCGSESIGVQNSGPLNIVGEYRDAFGLAHIIDDDRWIWGDAEEPQVYDLVRWSNDAGYAIGRNRSEPPRYSRFDWRFDEDDLLSYCHTIEGAPTAAAAEAIGRDNCAPADWIPLYPFE
jgi:hypothetical protein